MEGSARGKVAMTLHRDRARALGKGKLLQLLGVLLESLKVICNLIGILVYNQGTLSGPM